MAQHFDYIAIGGGSGGIASANRAAMYGKKVALIEAKELGVHHILLIGKLFLKFHTFFYIIKFF